MDNTLETCQWALDVFEKGKRLALPVGTLMFDAGLRLAAEVRTIDAEAKRLEKENARLHKIYLAAKRRLSRFCACYDDPCEFHRLTETDD